MEVFYGAHLGSLGAHTGFQNDPKGRGATQHPLDVPLGSGLFVQHPVVCIDGAADVTSGIQANARLAGIPPVPQKIIELWKNGVLLPLCLTQL